MINYMDQVAQIREKTDIVALISEYIPLKKTGQNFKTNCPFHGEKTPSFVVSPERQIWHCFGCQKGGDCYSFLMEYENLEFPEALRILAKKSGIELKNIGTEYSSAISSKKEKIYVINKKAMDYYHFVLTQHKVGEKALLYLTKKRQISQKVIETFKLGFAPAIGSSLSDYLIKKKNYTKDDLLLSGLSIQKGNGLADFFAKRIMFPLFDHRDNVVGFSGRIMEDVEKENTIPSPKYVNTRETLVYHKGSTFFGLNIAKDNIKKEKQAIIMEGEFDVMSSFQEGITNAVAVKGTALTENQVTLISRFTPKVSLCFDTDSAGKQATKQSVALLEKKGLTTTVIVTPDGKDPDEVLKQNPSAFKKAVKNDIGVYDYLLDQEVLENNPKTSEGKKKITDSILPMLENISNEIVKEHYIKKLANLIDSSMDSIFKQMEKLQKKDSSISTLIKTKNIKPREEILEEYLLALLLQSKDPKKMLIYVKSLLSEVNLKTPSYQSVLEKLIEFCKNDSSFDAKKFASTLPSELILSFDRSYLLPLPLFQNDKEYENEIKKVATDLKTIIIREKLRVLGDTIQKMEKTGDEVVLETLQEEFSHLIGLLPASKK